MLARHRGAGRDERMHTLDRRAFLVERAHVVAEGAGASSVAAGLSGKAGSGKVACVVSGGNLDPAKLASILSGSAVA